MTKIEELLIKLLQIPSVSGQEKKIGEFLISELKDFKVTKQLVGKERFNVIVRKGNSDIYIVVHMDTVPGVVPIKITEDKIYGRGAIDNKGNIAGAIMAARKLENINLIFTVGEEVDFIGVKKIITQKNIPAKKQGKFIVMEPTEFKVMSGQAGLIMAKLITRGVAKHSSLKFKRSDDAVYNLINLLTTFYRKEWSAFNVVIEKGGEAPNIIASTAEATMNVRPKDSKEFKSILGFLKNFKRKNVELKITETAEPFKSSFFSKGETVSYLSEMGFFKNSLLFGVGSISQAHTKDEFVLRKDLNLLEEKLFNLIGQI